MLRQLRLGKIYKEPVWKRQNSLLGIVFVYQTSIPRSKKASNKKVATKFFEVTSVARPNSSSSDPVSCRFQNSRGEKIQAKFHNQELVPVQFNISQHRPFIDCHSVLIESWNKYTWLVHKNSLPSISIINQVASLPIDHSGVILWACHPENMGVVLAQQSNSDWKA